MAGTRSKLRKEYANTLQMVWDEWNTPVWREGGPFFNLSDHPDLDSDADYNHAIGWIVGVSEWTGWPLIPGEKKTRKVMHPKELREMFEQRLAEAWKGYLEKSSISGSPFHNLEDVPELDTDADFNFLIGWLIGVSQVTGWALDPVGPREWSPRGWKGIKDRG